MIRADGPDHVHLRGAAHTGDFRSESLRNLYGEGSDSSRRADDQNPLPRLDLPVVAQALQGGQAGDGDRRRLLEGEVRGPVRELLLPSERILGEGALADAEHLVAGLEAGHVLADRLHDPGEVHAGYGGLGHTEPKRQSSEVGQTGHQVPHALVHTGRMHAHQRLVVAHLGLIDLSEFQDLG